MLKKTSKSKISILSLIFLVGLFFRLWHVDFGLPHYFHNDEPEIVELALTPAIEFRDTFLNLNLNKLEPNSFIYGTFPSYLLIPKLFVLNQINQVANLNLTKADFYFASRIITAILSAAIILFSGYLYKKLFKNNFGFYLTTLLVALNWKLIVFGHFVNTDIFLTTLITGVLLFLVRFFENNKKLPLILSGVFFGLAVGTKITALLSLLPIIYIFTVKKKLESLIKFLLIAFLSFAVTNPFSIIHISEFLQRIIQMQSKEGGVVFSSANENPLKYIISLAFISTPFIFVTSLFGVIKLPKDKKKIHIFLIANIIIYILFFSLSKRKTDRWLLPILPITLVYASYGVVKLKAILNKIQFKIILTVLGLTYVAFPILLLFQFRSYTPKSKSYLWSKQNLPNNAKKLIITETGTSAYENLENTKVYRFNVYESKGAQFEKPPSLKNIDYVVVASKPILNFKKDYVKKHYPDYSKNWRGFENKLKNTNEFELIKSFELPKPNIITLSNMYIYKNLNNEMGL